MSNMNTDNHALSRRASRQLTRPVIQPATNPKGPSSRSANAIAKHLQRMALARKAPVPAAAPRATASATPLPSLRAPHCAQSRAMRKSVSFETTCPTLTNESSPLSLAVCAGKGTFVDAHDSASEDDQSTHPMKRLF